MPNNNELLIQNLDSKITEQILSGILSLISPVINIKVFPDIQDADIKYAHVELHGHREAEQVLHAMDGRIVYGKKIKVSWNSHEDVVESIDIFISNLDPQVDNIILTESFKAFYPLAARVVRNDDCSKLSNGIITFPTRGYAESAIHEMDGKNILSCAIKCSWDSEELDKNGNYNSSKRPSTCSDDVLLANMSYEEIFAQAPLYNTSISIGNLPEEIIKQDLASYLQQYGYVSDIHLEAQKGTAIAKLDTHANATTAIFALQGTKISGKAVRFSWAKNPMLARASSRDNLNRSYNVFSLGHISPKKMVQQITTVYDNHTTTRPPAPAFDQADDGTHGWNQYYQKYYSAGHLTI